MLGKDYKHPHIYINRLALNVHLQQYYQHLLSCRNSSMHFRA